MAMYQSDDLGHRELVELVTDYLQGALAPHQRTRLVGLDTGSIESQTRDRLLHVYPELRPGRSKLAGIVVLLP